MKNLADRPFSPAFALGLAGAACWIDHFPGFTPPLTVAAGRGRVAVLAVPVRSPGPARLLATIGVMRTALVAGSHAA